MKRFALLAVFGICVTGSALAPALAQAAGKTVVTYAGDANAHTGQLTVTAAAGETNKISIKDAGNPNGLVYFSIRDIEAGVTLVASPFCTQPAPDEVRCDTHGFSGPLTVRTGDRSDTVIYRNAGIGDRGPGTANASLDHDGWPIIGYLGAANDKAQILRGVGTIYGQGGNDTVAGGAGPQRLYGGDGNDRVGAAGKGTDACYGGPGKDRGGNGCELSRSITYDPFFIDITHSKPELASRLD